MADFIDRELIQNRALFQHIKSQSDLFVGLFEELANSLPPDFLLRFHADSRGTKVSKGYRLENCPYEVLDIVRDFDPKSGFNIRLLQWWGHGLYLFVQIGYENPRILSLPFLQSKGLYFSQDAGVWDYPKLLNTAREFSSDFNLRAITTKELFQVFKAIELPDNCSDLLQRLKNEIMSIVDIH